MPTPSQQTPSWSRTSLKATHRVQPLGMRSGNCDERAPSVVSPTTVTCGSTRMAMVKPSAALALMRSVSSTVGPVNCSGPPGSMLRNSQGQKSSCFGP